MPSLVDRYLSVVVLEYSLDVVDEVSERGLLRQFNLGDVEFPFPLNLLVDQLPHHVPFVILSLRFKLTIYLIEKIKSGTTFLHPQMLNSFESGSGCDLTQCFFDLVELASILLKGDLWQRQVILHII